MDIKAKIASLPKSPGIYKFYDKDDNLIYIGKSISIKDRVSSYFTTKNPGPKTSLMLKKIADIKYIKVFSGFEALLLEAELIKKNQPFFNSTAKDDKSPLYIKITKDKIPQVISQRQKVDKKAFVKGPFPSAKTTREILRIIRRIFPYCHHKNPKKPCLYVHLGLCSYPYKSQKSRLFYLKNIAKIKKLLSGKNQSLMRELKLEMSRAAKQMRFEEANIKKKQIEKLQYITASYRSPQEFLENPALVDDFIITRLKDLKDALGLKKTPKRIECYDISNISGKSAAGSMAVFENGQSAKNQYRRFKIKFTNTPNDYQMLKEVLTRRFKNNWPNPDLIIIDGGRGQLNIAQTVLSQYNLQIPLVSLAKRHEEIYTPQKPNPISLSYRSPARQLVQAIRDEAHRFAVNYHRLLRSKTLLAN